MSISVQSKPDGDPVEWFRDRYLALRKAVGEVIVGRDETVFGVLAALIAGEHALLEGPPGTGKTLLAKAVARLAGLSFARVQFTPDLLPADILGGDVLERGPGGIEKTGFAPGPIFANVVLADEINRASPRTQAALLEAMEERQVTVRDGTRPIDPPFVVLATQNPLDQGTYPVPESQLDRFALRLRTAGPSADELVAILERNPGRRVSELEPVVSPTTLAELSALADEVVCAPELLAYIARLVRATHPDGDDAPAVVRDHVLGGVSARGARALLTCARIRAISTGRSHVARADVRAIAHPVLAHRLVVDTASEPGAEDVVVDAVLAAVE